MMHRVLMTRSNHPLQRTGAIKPIRQNDTDRLMFWLTVKLLNRLQDVRYLVGVVVNVTLGGGDTAMSGYLSDTV